MDWARCWAIFSAKHPVTLHTRKLVTAQIVYFNDPIQFCDFRNYLKVTRLEGFPPSGQMFTLCSIFYLFHNSQILGAPSFNGESYV
jgi:hypothetical protein